MKELNSKEILEYQGNKLLQVIFFSVFIIIGLLIILLPIFNLIGINIQYFIVLLVFGIPFSFIGLYNVIKIFKIVSIINSNKFFVIEDVVSNKKLANNYLETGPILDVNIRFKNYSKITDKNVLLEGKKKNMNLNIGDKCFLVCAYINAKIVLLGIFPQDKYIYNGKITDVSGIKL